jgi:hypothetical protein
MVYRPILMTLFTLCLVGCERRTVDATDRPAPFSLSVTGTKTCAVPDWLDLGGRTIFSVKVRLNGGHAGGVPANYFYGSVLTTEGDRYLAALPGCTPLLSGSPLRPGESREGYLNFPLPPRARPALVAYAPELGSTETSIPLTARELVVEVAIP